MGLPHKLPGLGDLPKSANPALADAIGGDLDSSIQGFKFWERNWRTTTRRFKEIGTARLRNLALMYSSASGDTFIESGSSVL